MVKAYISFVSEKGHLFIHVQGPGLQKLEEMMDLIHQKYTQVWSVHLYSNVTITAHHKYIDNKLNLRTSVWNIC